IGNKSEPESGDFKRVDAIFQENIAELKAAGAILVDPVVIPNLKELLGMRATDPGVSGEALTIWLTRNPASPFKTREDIQNSPDVEKMFPPARTELKRAVGEPDPAKYGRYLAARHRLMVNLMQVMADGQLDAIVHKSVEHQPTFIKEGMNPPYVSTKGVPMLNTFLVYVPAITVPSGFTSDNLPTGVTFLGKPYNDAAMIKLAYSYEQNTHHRRPPETTPALR